ncbi:MAG: hypothetical protein MJB14_07175 [Spirochaetes bacterium]|nr:hypothetical protein [Spirochaetota bacterium]
MSLQSIMLTIFAYANKKDMKSKRLGKNLQFEKSYKERKNEGYQKYFQYFD